jgi:hypothetical protein
MIDLRYTDRESSVNAIACAAFQILPHFPASRVVTALIKGSMS